MIKIKLIDKYIFKQVFWACFACVFIFMIIWIMPEIFLKTIQRMISGVISVKTGISILVYELPKVLNIALPVGMLLGSILTFDKLSKDFEITVLRGVGIKFFRKFYPSYIRNIRGGGDYRHRLVTELDYNKIISILDEILLNDR